MQGNYFLCPHEIAVERQMFPMVWLMVVPIIYKLSESYLLSGCVWHETNERGARGIVKDKKLIRGGTSRDICFFKINIPWVR